MTRPKSKNPRSIMFQFRITPDNKQILQKAAEKAGMNTATFVRGAAISQALKIIGDN